MSPIKQTAQYQALWRAKSEDRLPHALMFVGVKSSGKSELADYFSRALSCDQTSADGAPCDRCAKCQMAIARTHPDILWIQPDKPGAAIKVEQVRAIADFTQQTSFAGSKRMVIIHPADSMNISAANALLKTLEEPSAGSYLVLINDQNGRLPATIASRCQRFTFQAPDKATRFASVSESTERKKIFQALIAALDAKNDRIKLAADFAKSESLELLDYILSFLSDLLKVQLGGELSEVFNRDYADSFASIQSRTTPGANVQLMEYVRQMRGALCKGVNFNKQLLLESIFGRWGE